MNETPRINTQFLAESIVLQTVSFINLSALNYAWRLQLKLPPVGNYTVNQEGAHTKRGRPALRATLRERISNTLSQYPYPITVQTIRRALLQTTARPGSWNTIKKYVEELAAEGIVIRQSLPTENKRKPLVLYFMRGCKPELRKALVQDS